MQFTDSLYSLLLGPSLPGWAVGPLSAVLAPSSEHRDRISYPFVQIGRRLGRYEILTALGRGGMGEVYLARDTSVGRDVAIKLLPDDLLADANRLQRLRREARLLASLNHPNIASLYAFEEQQGVPFLVLELVKGVTLATRLRQGPLPLRTALQIDVQIADALTAAHERGVVHRDLKPSNVMLTTQGAVKLLDFGVARRESNPNTSADTASQEFADRGRLVGTPAYMSPEQFSGSPADEQSDIWAFGCVLYESLTGKHPFPANDPSDRMAAILELEPEWRSLDACPTKLQDLVKRCLRKDPAERLHDIADARIEVQEVLAEPSTGTTRGSQPKPRDRKAIAATAAAVGVAFVGMALLVRARRETVVPSEPVRRFAIDLGTKLAFGIDYPASVAISPRGDLPAYVAESEGVRRINVRSMDQIQARILDGTVGAQQPFFSPDGRWLGFFADGKLKKISMRGGAAVALSVAPNGMGGAWSAEGWIVFAPSELSGLRRVPESGGRARFSVE